MISRQPPRHVAGCHWTAATDMAATCHPCGSHVSPRDNHVATDVAEEGIAKPSLSQARMHDLKDKNSKIKLVPTAPSRVLYEKEMYSASVVDIAVHFCFFDNQLTSFYPKNYALPEVLLLVSWQLAWSASA
ncbi:hypothetical protein Tco_1417398 [Tanacetum coccineum]